MPINWGMADTQYPQRLADLFNPASVQARQTAASNQQIGNQLNQAQLMRAAQGIQRAPELARREDVQYQAQQAEALRKQQEQARRQAMLEQLPPEQRRMLDLGVPAKDVLIPEQPKLPVIIQEMRAAGISETSPEGQKILRERLTKPQGGDGSPSYAPIQGSDAYWTFDRRTGKYIRPDNAPLAPSANPELKRQMAEAGEGGKTGIEIYTKQYHSADAADRVVNKTNSLLEHLKTGDITTGMGADIRIGLSRAQALLGGKDAAKNATDSQIADVMMGSEVFPLISALGIGARGMDTPAEREFMRKVLTGELSLEKETLIKMAEIRRDAAQKDIDRWNANVDRGDLDNYFNAVGIPKTKFGKSGVKPGTPPPGAIRRIR